MSQQLTLEISDEIYLNLERQANAAKLSVPEWLTTLINRQYGIVNPKLNNSDVEQESRQRLLDFAGAISLGHSTGIDNESIDADLAKAYANEF